MTSILLKNARIVDGFRDTPTDLVDILVKDDLIAEVGSAVRAKADTVVIDIAGKTVMPGLIDCHVHVIATKLDLGGNAELPNFFSCAAFRQHNESHADARLYDGARSWRSGREIGHGLE